MELIIQQIAIDFITKIIKRAENGEIKDIDALASNVLGDCKETAARLIETIHASINREIHEDKKFRKREGLVLKEKDRPRQTLTELGLLNLPRDYYYDKETASYVYLMDNIEGIRKYERIGNQLSAKMVTYATEMSYAKSSRLASDIPISRQTVRNHILKLGAIEKLPETDEKKVAKELHIYADEDHVHMQRPNKERGKKSKIVPLVTVTEGIITESERRNKTVNPMHFVDENFKTDKLWESVEGYIYSTYDMEKLEKIYVHGDGGGWISNGLSELEQTVHVMDGYHLGERLRGISRKFPSRNIRQRLERAIAENNKKRADEILQSLYREIRDPRDIKYLSDFGKYLMNNWDEISKRRTEDIPGSCTEALISHTLSDRFSRDPIGWSEEGLGVLSKQRIYVKNDGKITAEHFKERQEKKYSDYLDQVIEDAISGAVDWTIFDEEPFVMDSQSGTQIIIDSLGKNYGISLS